MRLSFASIVAFATAALAQTAGFHPIPKPSQGEEVAAGSVYEIVWQPDSTHPGEITIGLLGGATPSTLSIVDTIATGVDGSAGKFSWAVPSTLGNLETYGIMITLESDNSVFQYGFPFKIVAGGDDTDDESDDESSTTTTSTTTSTSTATTTSTKSTATSESSSSSSSTSSAAPSSFLTSSTEESSTTVAPSSTFTSVVVVTPTEPAPTTTDPVTTNGAAPMAAGGLALFGGLAVAALAF
ncbi:hypothetical protein VTJ49DRAFT_2491 [Mycothermus thermophilus]|uniref:Yeast cell wall synthesis Kre9/Knh1-like N-terminal domain-containing protein n=1 Tax=Humicola insolens TaxID=85995 RepID=A0ABR3VA02_HUMIN